jgi:two-component system chemotaxis sensor kinase CheA
MNEFLEQFLVESRELAEQATDGLLALERAPEDSEQLDAVFRALHTLKGGAGIVDFIAMERLVHAAEDVLTAARSRKRPMTPARVGDCLTCVDQVLQWLDALERNGELPTGTAEAEADRIVARLSLVTPGSGGSSAVSAPAGWTAALLSRHGTVVDAALTAIRYAPSPESFFQGEDPVALIIGLPGLIAMELDPATPWLPPGELDPFRCNLLLHALTTCTAAEVTACLGHRAADVDVISLTATPATGSPFPPHARAILTSQLALMREPATRFSDGHLASAAVVVANVLRACGRGGEAEELGARLQRDPGQMLAVLQAALERILGASPGANQPAASVSQREQLPLRDDVTSRVDAPNRTLRVDAARIDALVRLTGELGVAKNALAHLSKVAAAEGNALAPALKARLAAFDHLTGELQRSVMALRVVPLRVVFQRFPRLLREMSETLSKPVELKLSGEDTEADKAIVEMLFEPLLHVLRNAMDHGVESTPVRRARGKPAIAGIAMRASRQGDQVAVEVTDDGGGLNAERIRQVAAERGVASPEVLRALTESEVFDLVFAPGFSTASSVTTLSGRGVGMDAVRNAVGRVGGRVSIESRSGTGTTVRFLLPFSVMMTGVMSVSAGGQMFGVPLDSIVETLRVPRNTLAAVGAARAVVLREQTIPVLDLGQMLGATEARAEASHATLVITQFAGQRCALDVEAIGERLEVMLKPLDGLLAETPGVTGTTLLGDGRVLLVLDIAELLQ